MKYLLHKCSTPSWTKEYDSEYDCRQELLRHICKDCLEGSINYYQDGEWVKEDSEDPPNIHDIEELLSTPCGCEFSYEEK